MKRKIALFLALATCSALLVGAQSTSAAYLSVYVTPSAEGFCVPAPAQLSYRLAFKAKVTASGTSKPKKIRIGFQVVDANSKRVLRSGVVNLKRSSGYKGKTPRFTADAGQQLTYHLNMSYYAYGKKRTLKKSYPDEIPSAEQIAQSGLPAC